VTVALASGGIAVSDHPWDSAVSGTNAAGLAAYDLRHQQRDRFGGGAVVSQGIVAAGLTIGSFTWTGNFTTLNLIAATTNALNGALLARRPDHYRNYTVVGVLLMALLGGIGGGVTRDVLINKIPAAMA
jgi:hypothetical protein